MPLNDFDRYFKKVIKRNQSCHIRLPIEKYLSTNLKCKCILKGKCIFGLSFVTV